MARLPRWTQKIFAAAAANNGQFGSGQLGTKVVSDDLTVLQALPAWIQGWLAATIGANKFPPLEEFQSIHYVVTTQLAYLFQEGIPAYDAGTTYFEKSIVKRAGTYELYGSLVDDNLGNALTDGTKWVLLTDLSEPNATYYTGNAVSTGTANAQVVAALTPGGYARVPGNVITFTAGGGLTNTGPTTLNFGGTGPVQAKKSAGGGALVDLGAGDITAASSYSFLDNGTYYVLQTIVDPTAFLQKTNNLSDVSNVATALANLGGPYIKVVSRQVFTSSGVYTPSAGMVYCDAELQAPGGGGAGSGGIANGGGGAGGYTRRRLTAAQIGGGQTVTLGAPGAAGVGGNGGVGGTSSLGVLLSATGGLGGTTGGYGGNGGVGSSGDINIQGNPGSCAFKTFNGDVTGFGGGAFFGGGGKSVLSGVGNAGGQYGGGGSGGVNTGGVGANPILVITEYCTQ